MKESFNLKAFTTFKTSLYVKFLNQIYYNDGMFKIYKLSALTKIKIQI